MKFNNPQHALRWAYETLNRPMVRVNDEPSSDPHAEASLLLSKCERVLSSLHFAYISVQFGREASGFDLLVRYISANLGDRSSCIRGIEQIIRAYCGQKIGLREIRKSLNTGMLKAASMRNRGYDYLDAIHDQAMEILRRELAEYFEKDVESV